VALLRGRARSRLVRADGTVALLPWGPNLVVRGGLDLVGALLCGEAGARGLGWLAVGAGAPDWDAAAPPADAGRTGLTAEVARVRLTPGTRQLSYDAGAGRLVVRATIPAGTVTGPLRELGLFGGAASALPGSGTLVNHRVHPVIDVGADDVVHHDLALDLPGGLDGALRDLVGGLLARRPGLRPITQVALGSHGGGPGNGPGEVPPGSLGAAHWRARLEAGELRYDPATVSVVARVTLAPGELVPGWPVDPPDQPGPPAGAGRPVPVHEVGLVGGGLGRGPDRVVHRAVVDGPRPDEPRPFTHTTRLVLSARSDIVVPPLGDLLVDEARAALAPDLVLGRVSERDVPGATAAVVVEQFPPAGVVVNQVSAVSVTLARVPDVIVPEIVGLSVARATAALTEHGLTSVDPPATVEVGPDGPDRGTVVGCAPPPGSRVPLGSAVLLTGAAPRTAVVPRVVGTTRARAVDLLRRAGFGRPVTVTERPSGASTGTVVAQAPPGQSSAPLDADLALTVAAPATVVVPGVVGLDIVDAQARIQAAGVAAVAALDQAGPPGLAVGAVRAVHDSDAAPGTVLAQAPDPDARAPLYGTVALDLAVGASVAVPLLVGMPEAGAAAALAAAGLRTGRLTRRAERGAEAGAVVAQHPAPGLPLATGLRVDLVLAAAQRVAVPDMTGYGPEAAAEALAARGLTMGAVSRVVGGARPGGVAEQRPPAGEVVAAGTAVDLVLADGVPALVGIRRDDAVRALEAAGLEAILDEQPGDGPPGVVTDQEPAPGQPVPADRRVRLVVSIARRVDVPRVVGRAPAEAQAALTQAELTSRLAGTEPSDDPTIAEGAVARQAPVEGTAVDRGSVVTLWLRAAAAVPVPDVTGRTVDEAGRLLGQARLISRLGANLPSESVAPGLVAAQDPAAGALVPPSTTVTIRPATAAAVTVPDVRGLPVAKAEGQLAEVGLAAQLDDRTRPLDPDRREPRLVAEQSPAGGTRVPPGSAVTLVLGLALPDLSGRHVDDVQPALERSGYLVTVVHRTIGRVNGLVIGTDPKPGTPVIPGGRVTLIVTRTLLGPRDFTPEEIVVIPDEPRVRVEPRPFEIEPRRLVVQPEGPIFFRPGG
jgi:beta-lactam-binding protein with PASTA domain